jgi:hypothetical protein
MKRYLGIAVVTLTLVLGFPAAALAQSGHFVGKQTCTDTGTTVTCSGKVAGLGGTTFEITVKAKGVATVECTNPAGHVAPGQSFTTKTTGTTDPLSTPRNGQYRYTLETDTPTAPADSCPNTKWTAAVTDVEFTKATLTLLEDGVVRDTVTVPVA